MPRRLNHGSSGIYILAPPRLAHLTLRCIVAHDIERQKLNLWVTHQIAVT